jgi:putative heme degradation protein
MPNYLVEWHVNVSAATPREAAQQALDIQRDPESWATVFQVTEHDTFTDPVEIDLLDDQGDA